MRRTLVSAIFLLLGSMLAFGQSDAAKDARDLHQDRREIRHDRRDIRHDRRDRKSTRLNSSHSQISYAVFCLKKKKKTPNKHRRVPVHQGKYTYSAENSSLR